VFILFPLEQKQRHPIFFSKAHVLNSLVAQFCLKPSKNASVPLVRLTKCSPALSATSL
jgi:hypothetical protein